MHTALFSSAANTNGIIFITKISNVIWHRCLLWGNSDILRHPQQAHTQHLLWAGGLKAERKATCGDTRSLISTWNATVYISVTNCCVTPEAGSLELLQWLRNISGPELVMMMMMTFRSELNIYQWDNLTVRGMDCLESCWWINVLQFQEATLSCFHATEATATSIWLKTSLSLTLFFCLEINTFQQRCECLCLNYTYCCYSHFTDCGCCHK